MKKAKKQSTFSKILNTSSIILIILGMLMCMISIFSNSKLNTANKSKYDLLDSANQLLRSSMYLKNEVKTYFITKNEVHFDNYWKEVTELKNREKAVEKAKKAGLDDKEKKLIDQILGVSNGLMSIEQSMMNDVSSGDTTKAIKTMNESEYEKGNARIDALTLEFISSIEKRINKTIERDTLMVSLTNILLLVAITLAVISQFVNEWYVSKKLIKPIIIINKEMMEIAGGNLSAEFNLEPDTSEIGTLTNSIISTKTFMKEMISDISLSLEKMANGNFNFEVTTEYIGEFKQIKESMLIILDSLNDTLLQISNSSDQVASGSEQVSGGAQALSQGATEQASAIEELSATINDISDHIKNNAQNAVEATRITKKSSESVLKGNEQMQDMINAMDEISDTSNQISKIIKTIDSIAFQTNILALNAAVEAARAGSAGKGFAVVAEEVRNLASKSAQAAKNTEALIETSIKAVENGKKIADATAESLSSIVTETKKFGELINEISIASNNQASSVNQVTQGVEQIAAVVQTNSATAEQSAAASEELSGQAQMLKDLVSKFKLKSDNDEENEPIVEDDEIVLEYDIQDDVIEDNIDEIDLQCSKY